MEQFHYLMFKMVVVVDRLNIKKLIAFLIIYR